MRPAAKHLTTARHVLLRLRPKRRLVSTIALIEAQLAKSDDRKTDHGAPSAEA